MREDNSSYACNVNIVSSTRCPLTACAGLLYDDSFASDSSVPTYDDVRHGESVLRRTGNTTDDGLFKHTYDAWNRLKDTATKGTDSQSVLVRTYDTLCRIIKAQTYQEAVAVPARQNFDK